MFEQTSNAIPYRMQTISNKTFLKLSNIAEELAYLNYKQLGNAKVEMKLT